MHPLDSQFTRDQLTLRAAPLNDMRLQPEGEFVLYWMQSSHRFEENWALRLATLEADRIGKPLIIYQGLNPHYEFASDRTHAMIVGNAIELHQRAKLLGYAYLFHLRQRVADDNRVIDRLAARAAMVVTDAFPTAGIDARSARVAARVQCRMLAVESHAVVPAATFQKEEWAARTIRPKLAKLRDFALEPVQDVPPRKSVPPALIASLEVDTLPLAPHDLAAVLSRCEIDHTVGVVMDTPPGLVAARARLDAFCSGALTDYADRRNDPGDEAGSSRLSPYLHFGQISAAEVARTVRERGAAEQVDKFYDELLTWRELSLNFCVRNRAFATLDGLPNWVRENMLRHASDPREYVYDLATFEAAATHHPLWNAAQRELVTTGSIHNVMRMYWGKYIVLWSASFAEALQIMITLNNKYGLDGRDPSSFGGIQWCLGKFDRPWTRRPVLGTIRYMSIDLAYKKFDARTYEHRWNR
ncbi:MAG: deoxyribodipyrimidine photo-lyase [Gemmatimonadaceae bacterium]|nr:deoxyribodipyrimidine photo-lyase [Gemmatimonadaceae bacterium]